MKSGKILGAVASTIGIGVLSVLAVNKYNKKSYCLDSDDFDYLSDYDFDSESDLDIPSSYEICVFLSGLSSEELLRVGIDKEHIDLLKLPYSVLYDLYHFFYFK